MIKDFFFIMYYEATFHKNGCYERQTRKFLIKQEQAQRHD